jgi:RNA polymerase sigma factor (TIGR02999 family)
MGEFSHILDRIQKGEALAAERLLPIVYHELRKLAQAKLAKEKPGQTLQATALVHEAYLRLIGSSDDDRWDGRGHFFAAAAEAMRRILVDQARRKKAIRYGGGLIRQGLEPHLVAAQEPREDLIALDQALDQLAALDPIKAELVKLRYFAGLTLADAAGVLGLTERTAGRDWTYARAWLRRAVEGGEQI